MKTPVLKEEKRLMEGFGKVFLLRTFELPDGKIINNYMNWGGIKIPIIIFPVTKKGEVIAVKQYRYGANDIVVEIPGGNFKKEESWEEVARKELLEETGYKAESFIILASSPLWVEPSNSISRYIPVLALGCQKVQRVNLDETEFVEVIVSPLPEWLKKIRRGEIRDSKTLAVTMLALPLLPDTP